MSKGEPKGKSANSTATIGSGGSLPAFTLRRVRPAHSRRAIAPRGVQSEKFVESHGGTGERDGASSKSDATLPGLKGNRGEISIYGLDSRSAAATEEVKWARRQCPFDLATRARRVKNGEGLDPFWAAATAGTKSRECG